MPDVGFRLYNDNENILFLVRSISNGKNEILCEEKIRGFEFMVSLKCEE